MARLVAVLLLVAACGDDDNPAPSDSGTDVTRGFDSGTPDIVIGEVFETVGRLSIADANSGQVAIFDLDTAAEVNRYTLEAPATLSSALSRQITAVVAAQPSADRFDVFGVGVWVWDHVDHFHVYKEPSAFQIDPLLAMTEGLSEVDKSGGWIVAFDQETGTVRALFERSIGNLRTDIERTRAPVFRGYDTTPHEGAAVVLRGHLFVTRADGGLEVLEPGTSEFGEPTPLEIPCEGGSAAASAGAHAVFACTDGFVIATWDEGTEEFAYQRVEVEGAQAAWVRGDDDSTTFVAGDESAVFLISADGNVVRQDVAYDAFEFDRDNRWLMAMRGSSLVELDSESGEEVRELEVFAGPMTLGDGFAYIGGESAVSEVNLETWEVSRTFDLDFVPGSLVVTAMWPGGQPVMH
ncbi:MAG: hypothetical protein AAGE52_31860 [Myxococcota bacterium]